MSVSMYSDFRFVPSLLFYAAFFPIGVFPTASPSR